MKEEFEELIGKEVTPEYYARVEAIYMDHPYIDDVCGKKKIVELYNLGILLDLYPRAELIGEYVADIFTIKQEIAVLKDEYESLIEKAKKKFEADIAAKTYALNKLESELKGVREEK